MKKNTLKLVVALITFAVGVIGTTFYLFDSFSPQNLKTEPEQIIRIVVTGRVVDNTGRAISGAQVQAGLGLDLVSAWIETDADGRFRAETSSPYWFKVCRPYVRAQASDFAVEWIFFDCSDWDKGERYFEQTIVMEPQLENSKVEKKAQ